MTTPSTLNFAGGSSGTPRPTTAGRRIAALLRGGTGRLQRQVRVSDHLGRLARGVRTVSGWNRPLVGTTALMAVWGGAAGIAALMDRRHLDGASVWTKPIKFTISLAIYAFTLAWMLSMVTKPSLRRVGWWAGAVGSVACTFEMAILTLQAVRGRRSHFNVATPLDSRLYLVMALALPGFYGVTVVIGVLLTVFSRPPGDRSLVWALRSGLVIGVSGLTVGFWLGRPTPAQRAKLHRGTVGSHSVGGDDPSGGLPFLGWNTQHGDLRVAHFIGMHALQGLPLIALALRGLVGDTLPESTRVRVVLASAAAWAAVTGTALQQALRGRPVTRLDGITGVQLAGTGLLASATAAVVRRDARRERPQEAS